jgi:hypothetical protein
MPQFGKLLRDFRKSSHDPANPDRELTQEVLGELIGNELGTLGFSGAAISDWERGKSKIHADDRLVLVGLLQVLQRWGSVAGPAEANALLIAGNYRPLDTDETRAIFPGLESEQPSTTLARPDNPESQAEAEIATGHTSNMPSKLYSEFVGRDADVESLLASLRNPRGKKMIGIYGIGGVGKSALAREVAERIQDERAFTAIWWTTAKQQTLDAFDDISPDRIVSYETILNRLVSWLGLSASLREKPLPERERAITKLLAEYPTLLILDNMETTADQNAIVQRVGSLVEKTSSRTLLTSRDVWNMLPTLLELYPLKGLEKSDAIRLMRIRARDLHASAVLVADNAQLDAVGAAVGYMPLALKLIVGLLQNFDLSSILRDLEVLGSQRINGMYDYIFANSWMALDDGEKDLLVVISTYDDEEGISASLLRESQVVADERFIDTIEKLVSKSLVEVSNSIVEVRYTLHPLTINFIRAQLK